MACFPKNDVLIFPKNVVPKNEATSWFKILEQFLAHLLVGFLRPWTYSFRWTWDSRLESKGNLWFGAQTDPTVDFDFKSVVNVRYISGTIPAETLNLPWIHTVIILDMWHMLRFMAYFTVKNAHLGGRCILNAKIWRGTELTSRRWALDLVINVFGFCEITWLRGSKLEPFVK